MLDHRSYLFVFIQISRVRLKLRLKSEKIFQDKLCLIRKGFLINQKLRELKFLVKFRLVSVLFGISNQKEKN